MLWLIKTTFITAILALGLIMPATLAFSYINPWREAIQLVDSQFPNDIWIPVGGARSAHVVNGSARAEKRKLSLLVLPSNKTLHFTRENRTAVIMNSEDGGAFSFLLGTLILYSLFFWQAPKTLCRIKAFLDRKSGYL